VGDLAINNRNVGFLHETYCLTGGILRAREISGWRGLLVLAGQAAYPYRLLRESVNVLLPGAQEIEKVDPLEFAGLADAEQNQIFLDSTFS
jgi:hypothetical protein